MKKHPLLLWWPELSDIFLKSAWRLKWSGNYWPQLHNLPQCVTVTTSPSLFWEPRNSSFRRAHFTSREAQRLFSDIESPVCLPQVLHESGDCLISDQLSECLILTFKDEKYHMSLLSSSGCVVCSTKLHRHFHLL